MVLKRLIALTVFAALAIAQADSLRAQWVQTNGPGRPVVTSFAVMGTTIFGVTQGSGVFRSTDMGLTWTPASEGLTSQNVDALTAVGNDLFELAGNEVYRTTDNGDSWDFASTQKLGFSVLAVDNQVLFGGGWKGIWSSTDHGESWTITRPESFRVN